MPMAISLSIEATTRFPLFNIVPNADPLYLDKAGHATALNNIAENESTFNDRRNRFLDHLMARFAESFTDYALIAYRIDSPCIGD